MVCLSLGNLEFTRCMEIVKTASLAEIRLDLLDFSREEITRLFQARSNLIATCRSGRYSDDERRELLLHALAAGAAFVDVELDAPDSFRKTLVAEGKKRGCRVILSYHNFTKTPEDRELNQIIETAKAYQADIIKIACLVREREDNIRLLNLLRRTGELIVVGMGNLGRITRLVSPYLGGFCTFASPEEAKKTAAGQFTLGEINEFEQIMEGLGVMPR